MKRNEIAILTELFAFFSAGFRSDHALNLVGSCNGPDRVGQPRVGFIPHLPAPQSLNPLDAHRKGSQKGLPGQPSIDIPNGSPSGR